MEDKDKKISVEQLKSVLVIVSMALLTIQHGVGLFAKENSISYIPLLVSFVTIFVGTIGDDSAKYIRNVALAASFLIFVAGCIIYTINLNDIEISAIIIFYYQKIMYGFISVFSLLLSILYVKQLSKLN